MNENRRVMRKAGLPSLSEHSLTQLKNALRRYEVGQGFSLTINPASDVIERAYFRLTLPQMKELRRFGDGGPLEPARPALEKYREEVRNG